MVGVRRKKVPKILFPLWSQCASMCSDPFWIELYTQASYGKTPKGFGYSNNFLEYNRGQKSFRTQIPDDPSGALEISLEFFRAHGIMSEDDIATSRKVEEDIEDGWKQINAIVKNGKKKSQFAEFVLREYCKEFCDTYNLGNDVKKRLFHTLFYAYKSKTLNDVYVQNCKVISIDGLVPIENDFQYSSRYQPKQVKSKMNPTIEVVDNNFNVRTCSKLDIPKTWCQWNEKRQLELGKKVEFMIPNARKDQTSCTTITETE